MVNIGYDSGAIRSEFWGPAVLGAMLVQEKINKKKRENFLLNSPLGTTAKP